METRPFDPAEYLDSEEAIAAYLADACDGDVDECIQAADVAARARLLIQARRTSKSAGAR